MGGVEKYGTDIKLARFVNIDKGYPYLPTFICAKHREESNQEIIDGKHPNCLMEIADCKMPEPNDFCEHCEIDRRKKTGEVI